MCVELRRTLKDMNMEDFKKYIWLERYRLLSLFSTRHEHNMVRLFSDFAENGADDA